MHVQVRFHVLVEASLKKTDFWCELVGPCTLVEVSDDCRDYGSVSTSETSLSSKRLRRAISQKAVIFRFPSILRYSAAVEGSKWSV